MTIQRMDNIGIVVDDLDAAIAFFTELILFIEPITLGGGKTLFPTDGQARRFALVSAQTAATGVQICPYRPAG